MKKLRCLLYQFVDWYVAKARRERVLWLKSRVGVSPSHAHRVVRRLQAICILGLRKSLKRQEERLALMEKLVETKIQDYHSRTGYHDQKRHNII